MKKYGEHYHDRMGTVELILQPNISKDATFFMLKIENKTPAECMELAEKIKKLLIESKVLDELSEQ